ncbi:hypothetical protein BRADI_3g29647v3 [Brachypodium distachyon]|uniref:Uncharacterized protein n=1 Tax=Brachypodium distachyon TaxID=15368 RepID=A0A2K2D019_BRADI|nr:hypothetical protein BRADI_3g29647v3 [Brachypodium distachyon]
MGRPLSFPLPPRRPRPLPRLNAASSSDPTPLPRPPFPGSGDTPASTPATKAATSPPSPVRSPSRRPAPRLRSPVAEAPRTRGYVVQGNGAQLRFAVAAAVPVALVAMAVPRASRRPAAACLGKQRQRLAASTAPLPAARHAGGNRAVVPPRSGASYGCSLSLMDDLLNNYAEEMVNYCTMASNSSFLEMLASEGTTVPIS